MSVIEELKLVNEENPTQFVGVDEEARPWFIRYAAGRLAFDKGRKNAKISECMVDGYTVFSAFVRTKEPSRMAYTELLHFIKKFNQPIVIHKIVLPTTTITVPKKLTQKDF